jgi:hypothetical protein
VGADRPINADVPAAGPGVAAPAPELGKPPDRAPEPPPPSAPRRRRRSIPATPALLVLLVLVAIAFIAAAVIGGSGGGNSGSETSAPAPAPVAAPKAEATPPSTPASETAEQLGYPAFATGNTTRVGGSEPASTAAAVALAVFPSTTESLRPAAVTLVGEDDWAGAIAASVLMSAPVRAPILVSTPEGLPEATEEALTALAPPGSAATGGAGVFAVGDVAVPGGTVTRVHGGGGAAAVAARIEALRDRLFGSAPAHVLIAPSARPQLAMPAAAWAARSGDPVLYAAPDALPRATAAALKRHPKLPVYVLGPSSAISSKVVRAIAAIDSSVKRVSGENPVANAIALARYSDGSFGWSINDPGHGFVLSSDETPLDAAAAAPLSASGTWGPLLLTDDAGTLPAELRSYLLDVKPGYTTNPTRAFYNHVWVIGDQEAIDVSQQAEVNELAEVAKIGGEG